MRYRIPKSILDAGGQVFVHRIRGKKIFVKKRRPQKTPFGVFALAMLHRLTGNPILVPPGRTPVSNVEMEAGRLRELKEKGVRVPRVLHQEADYFVMSDAGVSLNLLLKDKPSDPHGYVERAVRELRGLHEKGVAHGGAQIKNFTLLDDEIHLIDFETEIPPELVGEFQTRDLFLFILSLERRRQNPDPLVLCRMYGGENWLDAFEKLRKAVRGLRIALVLDNRLLKSIRMHDVRDLISLIRKIEGARVEDFVTSAHSKTETP